jgi:hypothetical protein
MAVEAARSAVPLRPGLPCRFRRLLGGAVLVLLDALLVVVVLVDDGGVLDLVRLVRLGLVVGVLRFRAGRVVGLGLTEPLIRLEAIPVASTDRAAAVFGVVEGH